MSDSPAPRMSRSERYKPEELLGGGGFAKVWRATDLTTGHQVAFKVLLDQAPSAEREILAMQRLSRHGSICQLLDYGVTANGNQFLALELMDAGTLEDLLEREDFKQGIPISEAAPILLRVLDGLGYAHERRVFHRDLKPSNVGICHEGAKLLDFGIAKLRDDLNRTLRPSDDMPDVVGTPLYMAPEQWNAAEDDAQPIDGRADLYAFGVLMYHALTGSPPFSSDGNWRVLKNLHLNEAPPSLKAAKSDLPKALEGVLQRLLAKEPADRFQRASEVEHALLKAFEESGTFFNIRKGLADRPKKRIFLSGNYYLSVDEQGYYVGPYFEGVLGIVVQVQSEDGRQRLALKLPRLLADTHRENAYISDLLEREDECLQAHLAVGANVGLMEPQFAGTDWLREPVSSDNSRAKDARTQHGRLVCVQFRKGSAPRFCSVAAPRSESEGFQISPDTLSGFPIGNYQWSDVAQHAEDSAGDGRRWQEPVVVCGPSALASLPGDSPSVFTLSDTLLEGNVEESWYACLPSIVFRWGDGTLQESVARSLFVPSGQTEGATKQCLRLTQRVLRGVKSLHDRDLLHADLRPANVMYTDDPSDPEKYDLIDYSSFSSSLTGDDRSPGNALGAAVGGGRVSPFYAPERLGGIERETADTALILQDPNVEAYCRLVLGWRSELVDEMGNILGSLKTSVRSLGFEAEKAGAGPAGANVQVDILKGDRVQLRDHIFEVSDSAEVEDGRLVLWCKRAHWRLVHGTMLIPAVIPMQDQWLAIPRVVVLQRWSAATDIFSAGVLLAYLLFNAAHGGQTDRERSAADLMFSRMARHLASPSCLQFLWPDLELLIPQLESKLDDARLSSDDVAKSVFDPTGGGFFAAAKQRPSSSQRSTVELREQVLRVAGQILHSTPGAGRLLDSLNNTAELVLLVHFVMCCLHRRDALSQKELGRGQQVGGRFLPFCEDRLAPCLPVEDTSAPIDLALARVERLLSLVQSDKLQGFHQTVAGQRDTRSEGAIRRKLYYVEDLLRGYRSIIDNTLAEFGFFGSGKAKDKVESMLEMLKAANSEFPPPGDD